MRSMLAALAIIGIGATATMTDAVASNGHTAARRVATGGEHLTAAQKRWFGRAIDRILRGER